jgi:hypothetical protein
VELQVVPPWALASEAIPASKGIKVNIVSIAAAMYQKEWGKDSFQE